MNKHIKLALIIMLGALTSGCLQSKEEKVKELLFTYGNTFDPSSTLLRNVQELGANTYCVEINSKNRLGGYVGWRRAYINLNEEKEFYMLTDNPADFSRDYSESLQYEELINQGIDAFCPK